MLSAVAILALAGCETVEPTSAATTRRSADSGAGDHSDGAEGPRRDDAGRTATEDPGASDAGAEPSVTPTSDAGGGEPDPDPEPEGPAGCDAGDEQVELEDGHCYMRFTTETSWTDAAEQCEALGGDAHLATITDRSEDRLIIELSGERDTWLGGHDRISEGSWMWVTRETWFYEQWGSGEPNDSGGEDCLIMRQENGREGTWDDRSCDNAYAFICEREPE